MVSALGFVDQKDKSFEHMSSLHFDFFSNTELNWYGKPQGMVIDNFLSEDYDILIDLSLKKFYPLTYLAVASPAKFKVGRYHSWIVKELSKDLIPLAFDRDKNVMALKLKNYNVWGVQFHPESILTEMGKEILKNWIEAK